MNDMNNYNKSFLFLERDKIYQRVDLIIIKSVL